MKEASEVVTTTAKFGLIGVAMLGLKMAAEAAFGAARLASLGVLAIPWLLGGAAVGLALSLPKMFASATKS